MERDEVKRAMQKVADATTALWDAERELELAIGKDVDGLDEYMTGFAVSGAEIEETDVDAFLAYVKAEEETEV